MKKITIGEAEKLCPNTEDSCTYCYALGYNTAVDEAMKEIHEATELANRSYQEGLKDGKLPIPELEKEIAKLKAILQNVQNARDEWMNEYFKLILVNRDNPSQVEKDFKGCRKCKYYFTVLHVEPCKSCDTSHCNYQPANSSQVEPSIADLIKRVEKLESSVKMLLASDEKTASRLYKLESSAIMEKTEVFISKFGYTEITKQS